MNDDEFWKSTPKQIIIKSRIYARFRNHDDDPQDDVPFGYIDDVF